MVITGMMAVSPSWCYWVVMTTQMDRLMMRLATHVQFALSALATGWVRSVYQLSIVLKDAAVGALGRTRNVLGRVVSSL